MLAVGLSHMDFTMFRFVQSIPTLLRIFISGCWILSKALSASIKMIWFSFCNLLMWCITLTDLWILNHPYIPGINPIWSWCTILLIYCWVNVFLNVFYFLNYTNFFLCLFYFTILYWFCHTLTWIHHGCTCVPHPEPSLPTPSLWVIPVHRPRAPCIMHRTWTGDSFHIWYTCFNAILPYRPALALSQSPEDCSIHCVSFAVSHTGLFTQIFIC